MVRVTKLELHRTISDIMKKGDLDQLTTKKIRILCEQKYNVDLTSRKEEIDRIVMAFVTKQSGNCQNAGKEKNDSSGEESDSGESAGEEESSASGSGSSGSESCSDSECSDSDAETEPKKPVNKVISPKVVPAPAAAPVPKKAAVKNANPPTKKVSSQPAKKVAAANASAKKTKKDNPSKQAEMDDAAYARQLQAEEWNFRQRTVRKLFRDIPHKKDIKNETTKKKKASPFMKKCLLSPALAEVIGTNEMSRPDVVQKMWSVVRERNLFDASNKQYAFCDDQLREIFGKKRIRLIGMMKYLKKHIKDIR